MIMLRKKYTFVFLVHLLCALVLWTSCKDDDEGSGLTATTFDAENITVNSADLKGSSTGSGIRSRGIVYNTLGSPRLEEDDALPIKPGSGEFMTQAMELQSSTKYYFRAYAFSDAGIVYGEEKTFYTLDITLPQVSISEPGNITANSALFKATVIDAGSSSSILERGFVWSTSTEEPTIDDTRQIVPGTDIGEMSFDNQMLEMNTLYYVRAYARSQAGIGYSSTLSFQTPLLIVPVLEMTVSPIIKGLTVANTVTSEKVITRAGVVYSETNERPTLNNSESIEVEQVSNTFTVKIDKLKPYSLYYVASFAIDENGTGYSEVQRVRTGTYGSVTNNLIMVQPPASYTMGWTSETDQKKDNNLFVNNSEANGNCVAQGVAPFLIHKYPVTNQEYCDFLNEYGFIVSQMEVKYFKGKKLFREDQVNFSLVGGKWIPNTGMENHPAVGINWAGANEFCLYYGGRLPDEAEWEIAARGGKYTDAEGKTTYSGSNNLNECGWYSGNSNGSTQPVGQLAPNGLGIHDMSGNVYEWTDSWYQRYQGSWLHQTTLGPGSNHNKASRGGSFKTAETNCRPVFRLSINNADELNNVIPDVSDVGFRFIMSPSSESVQP